MLLFAIIIVLNIFVAMHIKHRFLLNIIIGEMNNKKGQITLYFIIIMVVYFFWKRKKNAKETKEERERLTASYSKICSQNVT